MERTKEIQLPTPSLPRNLPRPIRSNRPLPLPPRPLSPSATAFPAPAEVLLSLCGVSGERGSEPVPAGRYDEPISGIAAPCLIDSCSGYLASVALIQFSRPSLALAHLVRVALYVAIRSGVDFMAWISRKERRSFCAVAGVVGVVGLNLVSDTS